MDTSTFLRRVLPSSGGDYFCNWGAAKLLQSPPLATLDDLESLIAKHAARKENVYVALGTYSGTRATKDAVAKRAFYLDLDCGPGKGFDSHQAATKELVQFVKAAGVPLPSIVVNSGRGLHVYWTLTEPVPVATWLPVAKGLRELCVAHDFPADAAITADAARILRVPGTTNWKDPAHPVPCRVVSSASADFEFAALARAFGAGVPPAVLAGSVGDDDLFSGRQYAAEKHSAAEMIEACLVFRHLRDTGGAEVAGQVWFNALNVLARAEDGKDYIHLLSNKHHEYTFEETEERFARAVHGTAGPTRCETFEQLLPSKCAACPHRGHIATPLVLGKASESLLPAGWKMTDQGISKPTKFDENGAPIAWQLVIPYKLTDVELYSTAFGNGVQFTAHNGPRRHTALVLGIDLADDSRALGKSLMLDHVMLVESEVAEFKRIMIPWMRKMELVRQAKPAPLTGLGWMRTDHKVGFATGRAIFMSDGATSPVSGVDRTLCREYSPKGNPGVWQAAASAILADECHPIQAAILSSFAAPLLTFTGVSGVMFSLHSRESGTGKSSALKVAQAVWGDPIRGVHALNDTANSMAKKFGFLNNLPAYWDEVRMRDEVRNFIRMIFQLGQGKEKQRLTASAKMQEMGTWSTITTIATNEPVLDHVDVIASNTNAGRLRVFEVMVPPRRLKDSSVPLRLRDLAQNYGHVGEDYAAWLARSSDKVDGLVQSMQLKVARDLGATNDERFWVALVAVLLAAAHLATQRKYLSMNIPAFEAWIHGQFRLQRGGSTELNVSVGQRAIDAVINYADQKRDQFLVVEHATRPGIRNVGRILIQPPIKEFLGLMAIKDRVLRIKQAPFRDWIYTNMKESPSELVEALKSCGVQARRASVSAGIAGTVDAQVAVLDVNLNAPVFASILEPHQDEPDGL